MTTPKYIDKVTEIAQKLSHVKTYEERVLRSWHEFEEHARRLEPEYDLLRPLPAEMVMRLENFVNLLYENLDGTPESDCAQIVEKDAAYGGSWHSRGGTGAFHALARKGDRIVSMMKTHGTFANCKAYAKGEAIDDTLGDLRRYFILVLAWHAADDRPKPFKKHTPSIGDEPYPSFMEEPEPPRMLFCTCGHDKTAHDGDGCNGLNEGVMCLCQRFVAA